MRPVLTGQKKPAPVAGAALFPIAKTSLGRLPDPGKARIGFDIFFPAPYKSGWRVKRDQCGSV